MNQKIAKFLRKWAIKAGFTRRQFKMMKRRWRGLSLKDKKRIKAGIELRQLQEGNILKPSFQ